VSLRERETRVLEAMDDPACDVRRLESTYRRFRLVNRVVTGWRGLYRARIRRLLHSERPFRLLDLGAGGGDIARSLAAWARHDGLALDVIAADPDERAHTFAARAPHPGVELRRASSRELVESGERFDLVVSNHVLHHLDALPGFLADCVELAPRALHNDIRRSRLALALYSATTWPAAGDSFLFHDGRLSIRRSYTTDELRAVVPSGWHVEAARPFRVLLTRGMSEGDVG